MTSLQSISWKLVPIVNIKTSDENSNGKSEYIINYSLLLDSEHLKIRATSCVTRKPNKHTDVWWLLMLNITRFAFKWAGFALTFIIYVKDQFVSMPCPLNTMTFS